MTNQNNDSTLDLIKDRLEQIEKIQNKFSDRKNAIDNAVKLITLKNESN